MSWSYCAIKHENGHWYVHENYGTYGVTAEPVQPDGESLKELYKVIKMMKKDIKRQLKESV